MDTISASKARNNLYKILDEVKNGLKTYTITLRGEAKAVVINPEEVEAWEETLDIDGLELITAVGFINGAGGFSFHGGPFFYYFSGDADATHTTLASTGTFWSGKASWVIETDSYFGGFFGTNFKLGKNSGLTIEYISTGDGYGIGAGIIIVF